MSKTELCSTLTSAIMIHAYGKIESSLRGDWGVLEAKIDRYATAVLGRDSSCQKRENTIRGHSAGDSKKTPD